MSSKVKVLGFALLILCFCAGLASADDRDRKQDRRQDRLKDGSCEIIQNASPDSVAQARLAYLDAVQVHKRGQDVPGLTQDRDRDRIRDRDKDRDCDGSGPNSGSGKRKGRG